MSVIFSFYFRVNLFRCSKQTMASYFGEINALSSRAVDDEEIDNQPAFNLALDHKSESKTHCKLLLIAAGDLAAAFSKCYLVPDNATHLFDIKYSSIRPESDSLMYSGGVMQQPKGLKAATAYVVNKDLITCEISTFVPEEIASDVCSMILDQIVCQEGLCLTSTHIANFKSAESVESQAPFIKTLTTSKYSYSNNIPKLLSPNFVSGVPAAFLAEFQVKNKAAACIINYVDSNLLDSSNVQMFESIKKVALDVKVDFAKDAKDKLKKLVKSRYSVESNLYT